MLHESQSWYNPESSHTMPESYLITGGNGLLGSHIVRQLLERGETAVAVFDIAPAADPDPRVREFLGDITNRGDIVRAVREVSRSFDALQFQCVSMPLGGE